MQNKFKKAITFSFDDGTTQDIPMIKLMDKYGLKGTFNLNSQLLGQPGILETKRGRVSHYKVTPSQVQEIYQGHEVAVHTLTHPWLTKLEDKDIVCQVEDDRQALSELVGYEVVGMAHPYGDRDERVDRIIREQTGVRYCRTTKLTDSFAPQQDLYQFASTARYRQFDRLWELGRQFVESESDTPQIFYVWGHTYELDADPQEWVKVEEFFEFISGRADIFYGTNAQVLL